MPLLSGLNKIMYELVFWKYLEEVYLNHHEVYRTFQKNKQKLKELEILPVQVILNRIASVFSKWEKVDDSVGKTIVE
jgi:ribosomal protein S17E